MGDIAFEINSNVDINKNVDFDINKDVYANVDNSDQLATAQSDAEAFGENALAETDTFTYVNSEPGEPGEPILNPGSIDALGNIDEIIVGEDGDDDDSLADMVTIVFDSGGDPPPDVDDINGFGSLSDLSSPPPDTADVPLPDPLLSMTDLNLSGTGEIIEPLEEGVYTNDEDWVVNFGSRNLDLDGDGVATEGDLLLTVPAGSEFIVDFFSPHEDGEPNPAVELIFEEFGENMAYFTHDGVDYDVSSFVFDSQSLNIGDTGDWAFEAASPFGGAIPPTPGDGESFSYSESIAALDLDANGNYGDIV